MIFTVGASDTSDTRPAEAGSSDSIPPHTYPTLTNTDKSVTVKSLLDSVIRFQLNGRETLDILDRVIKPVATNPDAGQYVT